LRCLSAGNQPQPYPVVKIVNPNVAIELGYALHVLTDRAFLSSTWSRTDLPFDLQSSRSNHLQFAARCRQAGDGGGKALIENQAFGSGEVVSRLRRRSPKPHQRSLRDVAAELAKLGFLIERGKQFSASSVASMVQ
jgi:hypothetical protein